MHFTEPTQLHKIVHATDQNMVACNIVACLAAADDMDELVQAVKQAIQQCCLQVCLVLTYACFVRHDVYAGWTRVLRRVVVAASHSSTWCQSFCHTTQLPGCLSVLLWCC